MSISVPLRVMRYMCIIIQLKMPADQELVPYDSDMGQNQRDCADTYLSGTLRKGVIPACNCLNFVLVTLRASC